MAEIIDVFDANHVKIGEFERKAAHQQGLWHQTFHCWIVRGNRVLLQLRSPHKANYPDMLDISAAGHLAAGEEPIEGLREIEEELGLDIHANELKYLGIKHDVMDEPSGVRNREFAHVYLLRNETPIGDLRLDANEVSGVADIEIDDLIALFAGTVDEASVTFRRVGSDGSEHSGVRAIRREELIPRVDNYYLKIGLMAKLWNQGWPVLSV